jgi:hypothetical protein
MFSLAWLRGGESENVPVSCQHQHASRVVKHVNRSLESLASDCLVLEGSVPMVVNNAGVLPESAGALPKEIDQFADPEVARVVVAVDHQGE